VKVAGFTFIRNAVKYDFPVVEAITSVLPLCDAFYIAAGNSDDGTLSLLQSIRDNRIHIIETTWDPSLASGGEVYAAETNKAMDSIPDEYDWLFYIQGDEVLHEKYLDAVHKTMQRWHDDPQVEGLLFGYRHFFATYDYVGDSRHWYRYEVRIIRNNKEIRSYRDAQGFRRNGKKLAVVKANAEIFHYGWVRNPKQMMRKIAAVAAYYKGITEDEAKRIAEDKEFNYSAGYDSLALYTGTHPKVMLDRITRLNWKVSINLKRRNMSLRYLFLFWFEKITGIRLFEFRNYFLLKP
jgi:hypothetical protein